MAKVSVELEGSDRLARLFQRASDRGTLDVLAQAMTGKANAILNESKRIAPFDTGVLKDSGRVENPKIDATGVEVEITYGGAAAAYAGVQHWDTTLNHPNGKQALYLQTPVLAAKDTFVRSVMGRYARYMKKG